MEDDLWKKRAAANLRRFGASSIALEFKKNRGNKCEICGKTEEQQIIERGKSLCFDHDHETGQIRGILCITCNSGLGFLQEKLQPALEYIEKSKNNTFFLSQFGPKSREELSEIARKTLGRPDVQRKSREARSSPEVRKAIGEKLKKLWADPQFKAKRKESLKKSWTPEARARLGVAISLAKRKKKNVS